MKKRQSMPPVRVLLIFSVGGAHTTCFSLSLITSNSRTVYVLSLSLSLAFTSKSASPTVTLPGKNWITRWAFPISQSWRLFLGPFLHSFALCRPAEFLGICTAGVKWIWFLFSNNFAALPQTVFFLPKGMFCPIYCVLHFHYSQIGKTIVEMCL